MEIRSINANQKVIATASAIDRDPISWQKWKCLYIGIDELAEEYKQDCLIWVQSIIEASFRDIDGCTYITMEGNIHVLSKNLSRSILVETAEQICDIAYDECEIVVPFQIYDLAKDAQAYSTHVFEKEGDFESVSLCRFSGPLDQGLVERDADNPAKILLIEDDPVTRWMVRNALKKDCRFASAPTANKAYSMYSLFQPDIVFLDIGLPDCSGHKVLEWILRNDPGACVIMFSSNDNLDNISNALENGASGFISKPFLKEHLLHYINFHGSA